MRNLWALSLILIINLSAIEPPKTIYTAQTSVIPTITATRTFPKTTKVSKYLNKYYDAAIAIQKEYNVPATLVLSLSALESNWGKSLLSARYNNFFGRKARGSERRCKLPTLEFRQGQYQKEYADFKAYETAKESFRDFALLLTTNPRYSKVKQVKLSDFRGWAKALHEGGYATDPHYVGKLVSISNKFQKYI